MCNCHLISCVSANEKASASAFANLKLAKTQGARDRNKNNFDCALEDFDHMGCFRFNVKHSAILFLSHPDFFLPFETSHNERDALQTCVAKTRFQTQLQCHVFQN